MLEKRSNLPSSLFLRLSEPAAEELCHRAMASQPRFAFEIANAQAASFCSSLAFEPSQEKGSLIENAMACGHLSLARLLFRKRRLAKQNGGESHFSAWLSAMESERPDSEILKSRSWTRASAPGPCDFLREATWAFAMGRPLAGLLICEELLQASPAEIEKLTRRPPTVQQPALADLSAGRMPCHFSAVGPALPLSFGNWLSSLASAGRRGSSGKPPTARDISQASLIELACSWAGAFEAQSQCSGLGHWMTEAAVRLHDMARRLWVAGAHASPEHYALLFQQFPLSPNSPQISFLRDQSESFQLRFLAPALIQACSHPDSPCGGGLLWDRFQEAHGTLKLSLDPNPFALRKGAQTPAAWSMRADMSLARLGAQRGFDPSQSDVLFMPPAVCAQMLLDPSHSEPLLHHELSIGKQGDLFLGRPGLICAPRTCSAPRAHQPGHSLIKTNLASMAAALGHFEACRALRAAGCAEPFVDELFLLAAKFLDKHCGEEPNHTRQRLDERRSACEAFILGEATGSSTTPTAPLDKAPRRSPRGA